MLKELYHKYNFLTESDGDVIINLKGFKYLSVLTDGAINPLNNFSPEPYSPSENNINRSKCYLQFDNNDTINIQSEIYNIPIPPTINYAKWYNLPPVQSSSEIPTSIQSGYGHIYFVLSNEPIKYILNKHNPNGYTGSTTLEGSITHSYWIGTYIQDETYEILCGYIPPSKYYYLNILLYISDSLNSQAFAYLYPEPDINNGYSSSNPLTISLNKESHLCPNEITLYGMSRILIQITNNSSKSIIYELGWNFTEH